MGLWDTFKDGFEDGIGAAGEEVSSWFGADNHQNKKPEDLDYVLYVGVGAALLLLVCVVLFKFVF
jgi:hypothetical protein